MQRAVLPPGELPAPLHHGAAAGSSWSRTQRGLRGSSSAPWGPTWPPSSCAHERIRARGRRRPRGVPRHPVGPSRADPRPGAAPLAEVEWDRTFAVNVRVAAFLRGAVLPEMQARRLGRIVKFGSDRTGDNVKLGPEILVRTMRNPLAGRAGPRQPPAVPRAEASGDAVLRMSSVSSRMARPRAR